MGKIFKKNQVIITALAIMIAVAGYLNFSGKELSEYGLNGKGIETASLGEGQTDDETEDETDQRVTMDISAEDMGDDAVGVSDSGEVLAEGKDKKGSKKEDKKVADEENPGAAVLVTSMNVSYFASAKISREQTRAQNKETLLTIVNNEKVTEDEKIAAVNSIVKLTEEAQQEADIETLLEAKGFDNIIISIAGKAADVIVGSNSLTEQQIAQIQDVVKRKTKITAEHIVITPVGISDEK